MEIWGDVMRISFKTQLTILEIFKKSIVLILATMVVANVVSRYVDFSFNSIVYYLGLGIFVIGFACVLESYRFGLINLFSGLTILLVAGTLMSIGPSQLTMDEKLEDYEYLYHMISENYPYLTSNERTNGINWLQENEKFKSNIKKTTSAYMSESLLDTMFVAEISKIVRRLNNNHTRLIGRDFFVNHNMYTSPEYESNFELWDEILKDEKTLSWYNFEQIGDEDIHIPDKEELEFKDYYKSYLSLYSSTSTGIIVPDEVAYLRVYNMRTGRIKEDGVIIRKFLEEVKDYDKLIIDIRGNTGAGDDRYWRENVVAPLISKELTVNNYFFVRGAYSKTFYESLKINLYPISELYKNIIDGLPEEVITGFDYYGKHNVIIEPIDPVDFQGEIYLLVDEMVYASAEKFASFSKDSGFATVVGKTTGGNALIFEPLLFSLPNSGLVVRYRGELLLNGDGNISAEVGTIPHIQINNTAIKVPIYDMDYAIQFVINIKEQ